MMRHELLEEIKKLPTEEQNTLIEEIRREIEQKARLEEVRSLRGILGMEGNAPTDEEVSEDYLRYLEEKYK